MWPGGFPASLPLLPHWAILVFLCPSTFSDTVLHLPHPWNPAATCQCVLYAAQTSLCVEWIPLMPFVASFPPPFTCLLLLRMALIQTVWSVPFRLLSLRFFFPVSCGRWLLKLFFLFIPFYFLYFIFFKFFLINCNLGLNFSVKCSRISKLPVSSCFCISKSLTVLLLILFLLTLGLHYQ